MDITLIPQFKVSTASAGLQLKTMSEDLKEEAEL